MGNLVQRLKEIKRTIAFNEWDRKTCEGKKKEAFDREYFDLLTLKETDGLTIYPKSPVFQMVAKYYPPSPQEVCLPPN